MRTATIEVKGRTAEVVFPSREDILNLKVGDEAPNCFGKTGIVTEIYAQRDNVNGHAFVCFYATWGGSGSMSHSLQQDQIDRTVPLSNLFTSHELDWAEHQLRQQFAECV